LIAGYKTYIAAVLAVLGALSGALDGDMTWQQSAAVVVPAVIGAALRHGLSTSIAALISAIVDSLAKAADQLAKRVDAILLPFALLTVLGLVACSTVTGNANGDQTTPRPLDFAWQVTCGSYSQAKAPLAMAEEMGVFDKPARDALLAGLAVADQLCSAPTPPTDINAAIAKVNQAAAAVLIAVGRAHGKIPPAPSKG